MSVKPLKKGDKVVMHTCIEAEHHDGTIWTCRTDEFKHHPKHDYTVIMLEGFSGSFDTRYLQKVNTPAAIDSIEEKVDFIDELERKVELLESSLKTYKEESDLHETSTYINDFMYELEVNEKDEIPCLINVHGVDHTFGITEKDAKSFLHIFKMHKIK